MTNTNESALAPRPTFDLAQRVDELRESLRETLGKELAENTERTYATQWKKWVAWADVHSTCALPADPEVLALFFNDLVHRRHMRVSSLSPLVTAIGRKHKQAGLENPTRHEGVILALKAIRRAAKGQRQKKADPLCRAELDKIADLMAHWLGPGPPWKLARDWAILTTGFAGGFRRSEITRLTWGDVTFGERGAVLTLQWSKTDQEGEGHSRAFPRSRSHLCPVKALETWGNVQDLSRVANLRLFEVSDRTVDRVVKRWTEAAGIAGAFSAHSLRAGFATQAALDGVEQRDWMRHANWTSVKIADGYVRKADLWVANPLSKMLG